MLKKEKELQAKSKNKGARAASLKQQTSDPIYAGGMALSDSSYETPSARESHRQVRSKTPNQNDKQNLKR